jgi:hypothetical protein
VIGFRSSGKGKGGIVIGLDLGIGKGMLLLASTPGNGTTEARRGEPNIFLQKVETNFEKNMPISAEA